MSSPPKKIDIYLEAGKKRVFVGATDWLGWCRSGKDETSALEALLEYAPRYAKVLNEADIDFDPPASLMNLKIIERLQGNATTDFGAPGIAPASDRIPLNERALGRLEELLRACWKALDAARNAAGRRELRKGIRGGGRETDEIIQHLAGADKSYLRRSDGNLQAAKEIPAPPRWKHCEAPLSRGLRRPSQAR